MIFENIALFFLQIQDTNNLHFYNENYVWFFMHENIKYQTFHVAGSDNQVLETKQLSAFRVGREGAL